MKLDKDDVKDILISAKYAVDNAKIDDRELKGIAFEKAIELLTRTAPQPRNKTDSPNNNELGDKDISSPSDTYGKIAQKLELSVTDVKRLFFEKDGDIKLSIAARSLPKNKATATKLIGLLLASARQICGQEDETPSSAIKDECKRYGRLDAKNFSKHILDLGGSAHIREESSQKRFLTITEPGFEETSARAKELLQA